MINQSDKWRIALQPDKPTLTPALKFMDVLLSAPDDLSVEEIINKSKGTRQTEILRRQKWLDRKLDTILDSTEEMYDYFFKVQDATGEWYFTLYPDEIELLHCIKYTLGSQKNFNKYLEILKAANETGCETDDSQLMRLCMAVDSLKEAAMHFSKWAELQNRKMEKAYGTAEK